MPRAIVDRLNGETAKILKQKEFEDRLQAAGVSAGGGTPEQLYEQVRREIEQWRKVVERAGIKIN
ncbi:Tripartite tricarboxylate transporter family receptor [compost metagenome]